jgi:hypothetical protein
MSNKTPSGSNEQTICCSFCGKTQYEVKKINLGEVEGNLNGGTF